MRAASAIAVLGVAGAVAALYLAFRPQPAPTPAPTPVPREASADATLAEPTPDPPAAAELEIVVADGARVSGPAVLRVTQGEAVTLRIRSDRDDELHVHGYDLHTHVHAGEAAELSFTAEKSGRFELELHASHLELGALEVQPR